MFCPKCGEKIPDGIAFCPKCGNKLAVESNPTKAVTAHIETPAKASTSHAAPSPAKPAISVPSTSFNTNVIVPLAIGVIALILAFMPWFAPSASDFQTSQYISDGANNLSSFFGGDSAAGEAYRLKSSYTMLEMGDYADTVAAYNGYSDSEDYDMLTGLTFLMWVIPVIVSAIGLVIAFKEKKVAIARIGFLGLVQVAALFAYMSMTSSGPIYPVLCCIASIATIIMIGSVKKAA
ncbi:zinc-ribbon domain-containing protein [Collinsella aerofaciens]|uniref:zinc-ribbon domain-containing protein n=1 Tax=Collinsella aerofaciens TaxID=74426 RepID=UPI00359C24DA